MDLQYLPQVGTFLRHVTDTTKRHDVSFRLSPKPHLPYPGTNKLVSGYVHESSTGRELGVATGKSIVLWLPVLVHESCHLDQCLEGAKCWTDFSGAEGEPAATDILLKWLSRDVELSREDLKRLTRYARELELDCERRTVEKIRAFELPIDIETYIQGANSYIFFYTVMKLMRTWYVPGQEPYNREDVWSLCPKELFPSEAYEQVPENLLRAYANILQ